MTLRANRAPSVVVCVQREGEIMSCTIRIKNKCNIGYGSAMHPGEISGSV